MRKLKLQVQVSIDGFMAGPNGEMDWMVWDWSDDIKEYVGNLTEPVETILLGRKLAEGFIPYWEQAAQNDPPAEGSEKFSTAHKVVFTKTLNEHNWKNTELATGNLAEEVNRLKNQPGPDLMVYGGSEFVSNLIKERLIDEFHLLVNPTALGKGLPVFESLEAIQQLKLVKAKAFNCGIVLMHYNKA